MPLEHSASKSAFKNNMRTLYSDIGKSPHVKNEKQAEAIAFSTQRRANEDKAAGGGVVRGYDCGGATSTVNPLIGALGSLSGGASTGNGMQSTGLSASPAQTLTIGMSPPSNNKTSDPTPVSPTQQQPQTAPTPMPSPAPNSPAGSQAPAIPYSAMPPTMTGVGAATSTSPISQPLISPIASNVSSQMGVVGRADGGFSMAKGPHLTQSWQTRAEARQMRMGPIISAVPGRTDLHQSKVPSGSYVLPSQHVASMGQGNSLAGLKAAQNIFGNSGPYGISLPKLSHGNTIPKPPKLAKMNSGGYLSDGGSHGHHEEYPAVPVNLAGGEFIIHPNVVKAIGKGSLENGHRILDAYVMHARKKDIKTIKNLPPPAKD